MIYDLLEMVANRIADQIFDNNWTGKYGEKLTERELKLVNLFGRKGKILKNLYLPKNDGGTSEIDLVYITQKGIFVIESKNYSGWIFGNSKDQYWTQSLPDGTKYRFYNPIKQNQSHLKWIRQYLNQEIALYSFIVFSERCELKKVTFDEPNVDVMNRDELYAAVRDVWNRTNDTVSGDMVEQLYNLLEPLTHTDNITKQAHIEAIQDKLPSDNLICPKCGSKLILRTARKGANAGNQFYGCSSFPKCRYTQNEEKEKMKTSFLSPELFH